MDQEEQKKVPDQVPLGLGLDRLKAWLGSAYSPSKMWKSGISIRITATVFMTILLVETLVLIFTVPSYEAEQLAGLRELSRSALVLSLEDTRGQMVSPLTQAAAVKLMSHSQIEGITVYGLDNSVIKIFGAPTFLRPVLGAGAPLDYRTADNMHY